MTSPDGLVDVARGIGGLCWVAEQLFELEGQWSSEAESPAVVTHLATHSRHHGWHAGLWRESLPDSPALEAQTLIGPPAPGWDQAIEVAKTLDEGSDVQRLAALYRSLVPETLVLIDGLMTRLIGPGDAHLARVARLVLPDVSMDAQRGYGLLTATMSGADDVAAALLVTKALDQAFRTC